MTVIKINAITVSSDSGDELARRFAARAGAVDNQDGFEGFELLQPTDDRPVAGRHPLARRGVVQGLGVVARLRPRPPLRGRAQRRPGTRSGRGEQRIVELSGGRRVVGGN